MNIDEAKALARINMRKALEAPRRYPDVEDEARYHVEYIVAPFVREIERLSGGLDWSNSVMDNLIEALDGRVSLMETMRCASGELMLPEEIMINVERRVEEVLLGRAHRMGHAPLAWRGPLWQQEGSDARTGWVGRDTARWRAEQPHTTGAWLCRAWAVTIPRLDADHERLERG